MLDSVVTIDIVPGDTSAEYAPAMVKACSQALPMGKCELANAAPENAEVEAVAIVLWQGTESLQATVRVGRHGSQWLARNLSFSAEDAPEDRWIAVGLTVATLVGDGKAPELEPSKQAATLKLPPSPATDPGQQRRFEFTVGLGGDVGSGWQKSSIQRGFWGSLGGGLRHVPIVVQGFVSYGVSDGPDVAGRGALRSAWLTAGLGVGVWGVVRPLDLRGTLLLDTLFRHVSATVNDSNGSDNETKRATTRTHSLLATTPAASWSSCRHAPARSPGSPS